MMDAIIKVGLRISMSAKFSISYEIPIPQELRKFFRRIAVRSLYRFTEKSKTLLSRPSNESDTIVWSHLTNPKGKSTRGLGSFRNQREGWPLSVSYVNT